ncbi:hypothetical protein CLOP_g21185 [Closterium sp. NIES-67]|nr:hypothetical protein CLOP_g21185 [Closterium sp. NIES-67]
MTQTVLSENPQATVDIPVAPDAETPAKDKSISRGNEKLVHLIPLILMLSMAALWVCHKDVDMATTSNVHGIYNFSAKSTSLSERRLLDVKDAAHKGAMPSADVRKAHDNGSPFRSRILRAIFSPKDAENTSNPKSSAKTFSFPST